MLAELLFMLFALALATAWFAGRRAAEIATVAGRHACTAAGVQWLDQSVHLLAMRLRRGPDGWLGIERHYGYEYSTGGEDRHAGRIVLHGGRVVGLVAPMRAPEPGLT